jgi:hypothetical protein
MQFIAEAGKIEPAHQILDIECGYRKHVRAISPLASRLARTSWPRQDFSPERMILEDKTPILGVWR